MKISGAFLLACLLDEAPRNQWERQRNYKTIRNNPKGNSYHHPARGCPSLGIGHLPGDGMGHRPTHEPSSPGPGCEEREAGPAGAMVEQGLVVSGLIRGEPWGVHRCL